MRQLLQVLYNLKVADNVITFLKSDLPPLPVLAGIRAVSYTHLDVYKRQGAG